MTKAWFILKALGSPSAVSWNNDAPLSTTQDCTDEKTPTRRDVQSAFRLRK